MERPRFCTSSSDSEKHVGMFAKTGVTYSHADLTREQYT